MKTSVEATGKNIEQAIENALFELKAPREDVDIEILSEGGLFKKAKVIVSISEDAVEKYDKRKKIKEEESFKNNTEKADLIENDKKIFNEEENFEKNQIIEDEKSDEIIIQEKNQIKNEVRPSAVDFIEGLIKAYGKEAVVSQIEEDEVIKIAINGEGLNDLIGYRGECLFALSYIMNTVCKRENKKQVLDICDYREKRAESLKALANRMANKVAKTGRYAKLEPMDASERRQIHMALQDNDKVTTMSKGTEPKRYVIIFPREYKE